MGVSETVARWVRTTLAALAVAAVLLALSACGDDDDGKEAGGGKAKPVKSLTVSVLPITDLAPLYIGIERGYFADEGLKVKPQPARTGGPVPVAAVQSGDAQIGWTNTTSLIIARSQGLKLRFVTRGARAGGRPARPSDSGGGFILVKRDSPVKSLRDLEGKTIAVAGLNGITTLTTSRALEKKGGDPSKLKFVAVPFPQALPVLESGRVDAAFVAEPFATAGLAAGHRSISRPLVETAPDYITAGFFTTDKYIAENKDVVDRFTRAVHRSFDYAAANPDAIREVIPTYTEIPPKVASRISVPDFSRYTDTSTIELTANLAKKYGYIKEKPDLSEVIYKP
jgi:NitT/TauT family transport system substrate-binding protein